MTATGIVAAALLLPAPVLAGEAEGTPDAEPYGVCSGDFCEAVDPENVSPDDVRILDPDARFASEGDPPGRILCATGVGCSYEEGLPDDVDADEYFADDDEAGDHRAEARGDADPRGRWRVTNRPGRVTCPGTGSLRLDQTMTTGRMTGDPTRSITARGIGERSADITFTRIGRGTYKSVPTNIRARGQRITIEAYLVMRGDDRFTGAMWGTVRGRVRCDFSRPYDGRRAGGGPTDGPVGSGPGGDEGSSSSDDDEQPPGSPAPTPTPTPTPRPTAGADVVESQPLLRFGNASTIAVDIYVDGELWAGVAPGAITRRAPVPPGTTRIEVHPVGADPSAGEPLASTTIELFPNTSTGISIDGDETGLVLVPLDET